MSPTELYTVNMQPINSTPLALEEGISTRLESQIASTLDVRHVTIENHVEKGLISSIYLNPKKNAKSSKMHSAML